MEKSQKILYIVRHAKSSWDYDNIADVDRPLKAKGIKSAYEIARNIKIKNHIPDLILSSPANRALHTALIFARVFEIPSGSVQIDEGLYESSVNYCLEKIKCTEESVNTLMVFGHNPDFTDLANQFLSEVLTDLPTAGAVELCFSVNSWKNIGKESLSAHSFVFPVRDNSEN